MTHASSRSAPTTIPGNRPARKTPGGNAFLRSPCGFVESIPEERLAVEVAADVEVVVDWAVDAVDAEELDGCPREPPRELLATIMLQYASAPPGGVMQSYPKGQQSFPQV